MTCDHAEACDCDRGNYPAGADLARVGMGFTPLEVAERRAQLEAGCPWCGAAPGIRCFVAATGEPLTHRLTHPSRAGS